MPKDKSAPQEYKALTHINLPFIEEFYRAGSMIPRERFEACAEAAAQADPNLETSDVDDVIQEFIEYGSLSEDPDAPLHPSHIAPDPAMPTIQSVVENAKTLVAELEEKGEEVPDELRTMAELDYKAVGSSDDARGGDTNAG